MIGGYVEPLASESLRVQLSVPGPTTGVAVQPVQPVPEIAVVVSPAGRLSVTVTAPPLELLPVLVTVIV